VTNSLKVQAPGAVQTGMHCGDPLCDFEDCGVQPTRVVNLRHEPFDIYIGRAGKGQDGYFGNPYRVGARCERCGLVHASAGATLPCFRAYCEERGDRDPEFVARVRSLRGKRLGCFCKPGPCHGDVYVDLLEGR
jgi:hypothetical protein